MFLLASYTPRARTSYTPDTEHGFLPAAPFNTNNQTCSSQLKHYSVVFSGACFILGPLFEPFKLTILKLQEDPVAPVLPPKGTSAQALAFRGQSRRHP
jgi:hypothetical protein